MDDINDFGKINQYRSRWALIVDIPSILPAHEKEWHIILECMDSLVTVGYFEEH